MVELSWSTPDICLYKEPILKIRKESPCIRLWRKNKKIVFSIIDSWFETLERWPDWESASEILEKVWEIPHWIQLNDIKVISNLLEQISLSPKKYINKRIHININPITLLDKWEYWEYLLDILSQNYTNEELYKNFHFEILEIDDKFSLEKIERLNSRIKILKDRFKFKIWIDDFPSLSNNLHMLKNIRWIDFVKIDTEIVLKYARWATNEAVFKNFVNWLIKTIHHYHPWVDIIIEWVASKKVYEYIKKNIPWVTHLQWHYFWKPTKL